MTPRELSPGAVTTNLERILDLLAVLDQMGELTETRLRGDVMLRLAFERVVTQLVELAAATNNHVGASAGRTSASGTYAQSFDVAATVGALPRELAIALKPSAGLRNILIHNYVKTDWGVVVASIPNFQADYAQYVREVSRWLTERSRNDG